MKNYWLVRHEVKRTLAAAQVELTDFNAAVVYCESFKSSLDFVMLKDAHLEQIVVRDDKQNFIFTQWFQIDVKAGDRIQISFANNYVKCDHYVFYIRDIFN
jgi:hypothetical protein